MKTLLRIIGLVVCLWACKNNTGQKDKETIKVRIINQNQDLFDFVEKQNLGSPYSPYYLRGLSFNNYCLIELHNQTDSDIYFQTCDSVLRFSAAFKYAGDDKGEEYFTPKFYKQFKEHKLSKLAKDKKASYFFIYKTKAIGNSPSIDTIVGGLSFTKEVKDEEWHHTHDKLFFGQDFENSLIVFFKIDENNDLVLVKSPSPFPARAIYQQSRNIAEDSVVLMKPPFILYYIPKKDTFSNKRYYDQN